MAVLTKGFASEHPNQMALVDDHGEMTWGELDRAVNRTIHALRGAGLVAGDTISIISGNRNEWFVMSLACSNAGITFVPVNWHLVGPEIAYIVADSGSKAVRWKGRSRPSKRRQPSRTTVPSCSLVRPAKRPLSAPK